MTTPQPSDQKKVIATPVVDIRILAAELFEIRKLLKAQSERAALKSSHSQSMACVMMTIGFGQCMAGANTASPAVVAGGLVTIAISAALLTR